jgi:hypothetical protein
MTNSEPNAARETQTNEAPQRKVYVKPSVAKHSAASVVGESCSSYLTSYAPGSGGLCGSLTYGTNCYYH